MHRIERLLVTTDFSECSFAAFAPAFRLADRFSARIDVVHVEVLHGDPAAKFRETGAFDEKTERALGVAAASAPGAPIRRAVTRGIAPAPAILDFAAESDIDLIVIGAHGRRGLRRFFLGSTSEELLRSSIHPVLVVPCRTGDSRTRYAFERLLVPVDFSERTEQAIGYASMLAVGLDARIDLLHVVDVPAYPDIYFPLQLPPFDVASAKGETLARLRQRLEQIPSAYRGEARIAVGSAADEICRVAKQHDMELVVLPSHGYSVLQEFFLGSVAQGVARRTLSPLLVIKGEESE